MLFFSDPAAADYPPARILLVDDNAANLLALEAVLAPLGQPLVRATSGAEALARLGEKDFALALMDVAMPVLDGFDTVEMIRRHQELRHLPVVFITAIMREETSVQRGYALGAIDFIMKPFEPDVLRAKVSALVALYQRNERIRQQERRIAEESNRREMAELASAVLSHDLRNPLGAIILTAEKLTRPEVPGSYRVAGERIQRSARRMLGLLKNVYDFARSRFGEGLPIKPEPVDLAELVRVPIDELRTIHPDTVIVLNTGEDTRGEWDAERLTQAVGNLVDNAVKHATGAHEQVSVSVEGTVDAVEVRVHNAGVPIPPELKERLFEPFQRGTQLREGLGLGLFIVDQIVRGHGGTILVESAEATGTTFTIRLPRHVRGSQ